LTRRDFSLVRDLLRTAAVTRLFRSLSIPVLALIFTVVPALARAQQQTPTTTADPAAAPPPASASADATSAAPVAASKDAQPDEDNDAQFRPLEPDFTLINLPTTLPLPVHKGNFRLTHRFNGNLRNGDFGDQASNLFGIDEGAAVGFEYRFGIVKHVELAVYRANIDRTIQIYGKYDGFHEGGRSPVGFSAIVSVEGTNNFRQDYAPTIGASISRSLGHVAEVYAVPMWMHNVAASTGITRDTGIVGLGTSIRVRPALYLTGEVSPRLGGYVIGDPEYGFGVQMRVGGHVFDLSFTNGQGTTFAQMARGGNPDSLYFGFNLARKFF
jgi:hypothetical protein